MKSKQDKPSGRANAIATPLIDFLCCGGASIVAVVGLFAYAWVEPESRLFRQGIELRDIIVLTLLINFPHFMASYRLLYQPKEQISKYSWASVYIPAILVVLVLYALATPSQDPENPEFANGAVVEILTVVGALLLAWHYTGQAWGMTASFAFLGGVRFERFERLAIRSGYYALMLFHIAWTIRNGAQSSSTVFFTNLFADYLREIELLFFLTALLSLMCLPLGLIGFLRVRMRTGKRLPWRAIIPWVAIFLWYFLIWRYPRTFLCLQIFHALQYLIFPLRVEANRHAKRAENNGSAVSHVIWVYVLLTAVGAFVFLGPRVTYWFGDTNYVVQAMVAAIINIHHYFIDGAIWKIRNPQVRKDLFSHVLE